MQLSKNKGFTLIELISVIVILGVLSAFALPRFANLSTDSRIAVLEGLKGTIKVTASRVYMECRLADDCDVTLLGTPQTLNGADICLVYGYFDGGATLGSNCTIDNFIDVDGFTASNGDTGTAFETWFRLDSAPTPSSCYVAYVEPGLDFSSPFPWTMTSPWRVYTETSGCWAPVVSRANLNSASNIQG